MAITDVAGLIQNRLTNQALLGTYTYGALVIPAIMAIPDPQWGNDPPEIINGSPLVISGIEVIVADTLEGLTATPMINNEALLEYEYAVLLKDWTSKTNANLKLAIQAIAGELFLISTNTPQFDKAVLPRVAILTVSDPVRCY